MLPELTAQTAGGKPAAAQACEILHKISAPGRTVNAARSAQGMTGGAKRLLSERIRSQSTNLCVKTTLLRRYFITTNCSGEAPAYLPTGNLPMKPASRAFLLVLGSTLTACGDDTVRIERPADVTMTPAAFGAEYRLVDSVLLEQPDTAVIARLSGIDVDRSGRILIGDVSEKNVKLFAPDGRLIRILGRNGGGPGEFSSPRYPRFGSDGLIYVADAQNGRIQGFDDGGKLRRLTHMQDVGLITGFHPRPDGTYLLAAEIGEDPHILVRVDTAGRVLQRFLPIRDIRPTAQPEYELWRNVRNFFMDVSGDTAYVTSTISDSVWTVHIPTGREGRFRLNIPGYVPPSPAEKMPESIPALMQWGDSFHSGSTLSIDGRSLFLPYVQGVLNNGDPMLLVTRSHAGQWRVLEGAPPVIGAANGRAVAILNPGEDQIRLGFFERSGP